MSFTKSGPSFVRPTLGTCSREDRDRVGDTSPGLKEGFMLDRGRLELPASLPNEYLYHYLYLFYLNYCLSVCPIWNYIILSNSPET